MNTEMESKSLVLYDRDIREPLFDYLEERFGKTRMFEEKIIGRSRADIIMLTERQLIGLEIKSDADTYERLKRQIRDYNKYCDVNYVVVGKSHEKHVRNIFLPGGELLWWKQREKEMVINEKKSASENPKMKRELQITLLWRPELQKNSRS